MQKVVSNHAKAGNDFVNISFRRQVAAIVSRAVAQALDIRQLALGLSREIPISLIQYPRHEVASIRKSPPLSLISADFPCAQPPHGETPPRAVVQADRLGTGLPQTIIAMITSNLARASHPSRVTILQASPEGKQAGLLVDSVVMTDNLAAVRESEIDRAIDRLSEMSGVDAALRHT